MNKSGVLVVEDDVILREVLAETLDQAGYDVITAEDGYMAMTMLKASNVNLVVSDINMPKMNGMTLLQKVSELYPKLPVMLMTAFGTIEQAVSSIRYGAVDYLVKPFEAEVLVNMVSRYIPQVNHSNYAMIAESDSSKKVLILANKVADSTATLMITGESGTGKEVLAQYVHEHSERKSKPFIAINCAAIPENMLEATLFGYEKGAYTGAYKSSPGKFEQAQGGTLLLDEISEMDLGLQAKLLRVLQEREVERLGGSNLIQLDVRVIATSNKDIHQAVNENKFREDLYYRLNVFPLHISPLRDRIDDIIPLTFRILEKNSREQKKTIPEITAEAQTLLLNHDWPGNVRELDNVLQRAQILQSNINITEDDILFEEIHRPTEGKKIEISDMSNTSLNVDLKKREWEVILRTMHDLKGSRKATSEKLGISQRTLRYKLASMREAGVAIPETRNVEIV